MRLASGVVIGCGTLPHPRTYQTVAQGHRSAFFTKISGETGLAENTLRRQMAALAYLEAQRLDLETLGAACPPVMAIEAVASIGKVTHHPGKQVDDNAAGAPRPPLLPDSSPTVIP